jgi:hypothetical protein
VVVRGGRRCDGVRARARSCAGDGAHEAPKSVDYEARYEL